MESRQAKFITFEGCDGCGKTTQTKLLYQALNSAGVQVVRTREPGGTPSAELIRELLVTGAVDKWEKMTEVMLHMAARNEHVSKFIKPHLASNHVVICDRFVDSTIAYQGYGHGISLATINLLHQALFEDFYPDLTIVFDSEVSHGLQRANQRKSAENRYEQMDHAFHDRVRQGFLDIAKQHPERCVLINASLSVKEVHRLVLQAVNQRLGLSVFSE